MNKMACASVIRSLDDLHVVYKQCKVAGCKCGQGYHCLLCPVDKFKGKSVKKVQEHVAAVHAGPYMLQKDGFLMLHCSLACHKDSHWHCPACGEVQARKARMLQHLEQCQFGGIEENQKIKRKSSEKNKRKQNFEEPKRNSKASKTDQNKSSTQYKSHELFAENETFMKIQEGDTDLTEKTPIKKERNILSKKDTVKNKGVESEVSHAWVDAIVKKQEKKPVRRKPVTMLEGQKLSVLDDNKDVQIQQCNTCCTKYHCPLCTTATYKPRHRQAVQRHWTNTHLHRSVRYKGKLILKCRLECQLAEEDYEWVVPQSHWHCPLCPRAMPEIKRLQNHLASHDRGTCRDNPLSMIHAEFLQDDDDDDTGLGQDVTSDEDAAQDFCNNSFDYDVQEPETSEKVDDANESEEVLLLETSAADQQQQQTLSSDRQDSTSEPAQDIKTQISPSDVYDSVSVTVGSDILESIPGNAEKYFEKLAHQLDFKYTLDQQNKVCKLEGRWESLQKARIQLEELRQSKMEVAECEENNATEAILHNDDDIALDLTVRHQIGAGDMEYTPLEPLQSNPKSVIDLSQGSNSGNMVSIDKSRTEVGDNSGFKLDLDKNCSDKQQCDVEIKMEFDSDCEIQTSDMNQFLTPVKSEPVEICTSSQEFEKSEISGLCDRENKSQKVDSSTVKMISPCKNEINDIDLDSPKKSEDSSFLKFTIKNKPINETVIPYKYCNKVCPFCLHCSKGRVLLMHLVKGVCKNSGDLTKCAKKKKVPTATLR